MFKKILPYILTTLGFCLVVLIIFLFGSNYGSNKITSKWNQEKLEYSKRMNAALEAKAEAEKLAQKTVTISEDKLNEAKTQFTATLNAVSADYDKRLLDSRTRESIYKRQAEGSSSEQQRLAVHAAELDRSLVEGKEVARQLAATVRLRDAEIIALANVIRAYETMLKE